MREAAKKHVKSTKYVSMSSCASKKYFTCVKIKKTLTMLDKNSPRCIVMILPYPFQEIHPAQASEKYGKNSRPFTGGA